MTKDIAKRPRGAANNSCVDVDATIPFQGHARQQEADELRARVAELEAGDDDRRSASIHLRKSQAGRILDGRTWDEMPEDTHG